MSKKIIELIRHRHRLMCSIHTQVFASPFLSEGNNSNVLIQEELMELKQKIVDLIDEGTR